MDALDKVLPGLISGLISGLLIAGVGTVLKGYFDRKIEALKSDLSWKTHARKALFDRETEFYLKLSPALASLQDVLLNVTASTSLDSPDKTALERRQDTQQKLCKTYNEVIALAGANRPFYTKDLEEKLDVLIKECSMWIDQHQIIISEMIRTNKEFVLPSDYQEMRNGFRRALQQITVIQDRMRSHFDQYRDS